MKFTEKMINDCYADFYDAVRPPCAVARAIQAFLKDLYDPSKKGEPEKNWLKFLLSHYSKYFHASEAADCLEQWERLKAKVMDCENLKNMQFGDLWPLLISQYTNNFEIILRLAVINLLFIMDNSQCERDFSLMNHHIRPRSTTCDI